MAIARLVAEPPTNATVNAVPRSVVSSTFVAANSGRRGLIIYNDTTAGFLYIKVGPGASTADFTVKLLPLTAFYFPYPVYIGVVSGVWGTSGSGSASVTELL